ncbi:hypothetical protein DXG01_008507 [Tephrocybe rancida]|nr:hypothetical protein DXG01_008507 [Tephrocybe rancida]
MATADVPQIATTGGTTASRGSSRPPRSLPPLFVSDENGDTSSFNIPPPSPTLSIPSSSPTGSFHKGRRRGYSATTSTTFHYSPREAEMTKMAKREEGEDLGNVQSTARQNELDQDRGFDPSLFSFRPSELAHLVNPPRSQNAMTRFGGTQALLDGLGANAKRGLGYAAENENPQNLPTPGFINNIFSASFDERRRAYGTNNFPAKRSKPLLSLMWLALKDKALVLLSIAAIVSLAFRLFQDFGIPLPQGEPPMDWVEGVAIMAAIVIVVVVGSLNDWQKERQFKQLSDQKDERGVKVIRNGVECIINIKDVVVGDVALIEPGEVIPCDGIFISGHNVRCEESNATGESETVSKLSYEDCMDRVVQISHEPHHTDCYLVSGSKVLEGVGRYVVIAVGTKSLRGPPQYPETTFLQLKLNNAAELIAKIGSIAGLLLFIALMIRFFVQLGQDKPMRTANQKGIIFINILILSVTLIVVAVPEGLPLAVTLALAFATKRMTYEKLLVRVLGSCERLTSASFVCTDKTGTLTQNTMTVVAGSVGVRAKFVRQLEANQLRHNVDTSDTMTSNLPLFAARSSLPPKNNDFPIDQAHLNDIMPRVLQDLFNEAIVVNSTAFEDKDPKTGELVFVGSQTETALLQFAKELEWNGLQITREKAAVVDRFPFSSERMASGVVVRLSHSRKYRLYVTGAPEILSKACSTHVVVHSPSLRRDRQEADAVETMIIGPVEEENISRTIAFYAEQSLRTIALCYKEFEEWPPACIRLPFADMAKDLTLIGIAAIENPLRPGVQDAVSKCLRAGVAVKMCTGDNVLTARSIAVECGILQPGGIFLEGSQFRKLDRDERIKIVPQLQVLARCSPSDKKLLVGTLKSLGGTVAAIGNGPVLEGANVGFSRGIAGTEVAKDASDIILMDDNFSSIVKAIIWGRCISDAVRKFLQFHTTANITVIIITFMSAVLNPEETSVLSIVQLLWINIIIDTFAALALATDSASESLLDRRPDKVTAPLFTIDMYKQILLLATYQVATILVFHFLGLRILGLELTGDGLKDKHTRLTVQTLVFNVFVFTQIFNLVNCRRLDKKLNVFEGILVNRYFLAIILLEIGVQTLIVFISNETFQVTKMGGREWGISLALGIAPIPLGAMIRLLPNGPFEKLLVRLGIFSTQEVLPTANKGSDVSTNAAVSIKGDLGTFRKIRGARLRSSSFVMKRRISKRKHSQGSSTTLQLRHC